MHTYAPVQLSQMCVNPRKNSMSARDGDGDGATADDVHVPTPLVEAHPKVTALLSAVCTNLISVAARTSKHKRGTFVLSAFSRKVLAQPE